MTAEEIRELVRERSRPLTADPPAGVAVDIRPLGVRAVLFDVYGTLLISAAGDIGSASPLADRVARHHAAARAAGVDWPEVDVRALWAESGVAAGAVERVALELRTDTGMPLQRVARSQERALRTLCEEGLAEISGDALVLTRSGKALCDRIAEMLLPD